MDYFYIMVRLSCITVSLMMVFGSMGQIHLNQLDSVLSGPADPLEPLIFKMVVENDSNESVILEMVRSNLMIDSDWAVSLCTDACLPPEQDIATLSLANLDIDTVSVYFFMDGEGIGSVDVAFRLINTTEEIAHFSFLAEGLPPLSLDAEEQEIAYLQTNRSIEILSAHPTNYTVRAADLRMVKKGRLDRGGVIEVEEFRNKLIIINLWDESGRFSFIKMLPLE